MVAGRGIGAALGKLVGVPIRVTVASDYAAVVEALRNRTATSPSSIPAGYVLANREAKAMIVAKDQWHGNTSYTSRIYVRKESGLKTLEELPGQDDRLRGSLQHLGLRVPDGHAHREGARPEQGPQDVLQGLRLRGSHDAGLLALLNGHVDALASFDQGGASST
jgi:phosphonate transport system substrate-binding protein